MAGVKVWPAPAVALAPPPVWDVRHAALGQLPAANEAQTFLPELRNAAARVLVAASGADLVFVGRSPEPLYFYLLGLLDGTNPSFGLSVCNVSLRWKDLVAAQSASLRGLLTAAGVHPRELVRGDRRLALVDVVASGGTFHLLADELGRWAEEGGVGKRSVWRRVRFVGLTHQHSANWAAPMRFQTGSVRLDWPLWAYLGNSDEKVAPWHPPSQWTADHHAYPERTPERLQALADARALLTLAQTAPERRRFVRELNRVGGNRLAVLRHLGLELKA